MMLNYSKFLELLVKWRKCGLRVYIEKLEKHKNFPGQKLQGNPEWSQKILEEKNGK